VVSIDGVLKIRPSMSDVYDVRGDPTKPKRVAGDDEIIVYGRDGCGWCSKIKKDFDSSGIEYSFVSCDDDAGNREMWGFL
jgi:hypothetical protein